MKAFIAFLVSLVACVTVGALPPGIYSGTFQGVQQGDFVAITDGYGYVTVVGFDQTYKEAFINDAQLDAGGNFSAWTDAGLATGRVTETSLSGTLPGITFSATRERPTGPYAAFAGVYLGRYSGASSGEAVAIIVPSGKLWLLAEGYDNWDAGTGSVRSGGAVSMTTYFNTRLNVSISGGRVAGTWQATNGASGSLTADRVITLAAFLDLVPLARERVDRDAAYHPKLGWYQEVSYPWVWMDNHGWWYFSSAGSDAAWVHDRVLGWLYVARDSNGWVYASAQREWLYLGGKAGGSRLIFTKARGWFTVPRSL